MKKILIVLAVMAAQMSFAQVNMELFKRDQVWLFEKKKQTDLWHGIVFMHDRHTYMYSTGAVSKEFCMSKNKSLRQAHFCHDQNNMWSTEYEIVGQKIKNPRSGYYWNITKLTDDTMIIERGAKHSEESSFDEVAATKMVFKRNKATKKRYPKWTSGSSEDCKDLRRNNGNENMVEEYIKFR